MQNGQGMSGAVGARLSVMMFIQFFIWGAWYVTAPRVLGPLGFAGGDIGWTYSVGPLAGIISPLFVGMIADRFFATKYVLAAMHFGAAGAMCLAIALMNAAEPIPAVINTVFFLHMLCYFPTLALANTVAMQNMTDSEKQFPLIRVFGTIGWIVAGLLLDKVFGWATSMGMFYLAAGAGFVLGAYSLTLPYNPPPSAGRRFRVAEAFGLDALVLLKNPSFLIFMLSSFLICIPLAFYYQMAERTLGAGEVSAPAFKMTFGQMSEIIFMVLMPFFFARLGVKGMLFVGMLAWVVRYGLFAAGMPEGVTWMLLTGVVLHGICYDFFFVTGQIYTDRVAPPAIRAQAQGMLVLFTLGLGMLIGAQIGGRVEAAYTPAENATLTERANDLAAGIGPLEERLAGAPESEKAALTTEITTLQSQVDELRTDALQTIDWKSIWRIPAIGAAVVLALFTIAFRDTTRKKPYIEHEGEGTTA